MDADRRPRARRASPCRTACETSSTASSRSWARPSASCWRRQASPARSSPRPWWPGPSTRRRWQQWRRSASRSPSAAASCTSRGVAEWPDGPRRSGTASSTRSTGTPSTSGCPRRAGSDCTAASARRWSAFTAPERARCRGRTGHALREGPRQRTRGPLPRSGRRERGAALRQPGCDRTPDPRARPAGSRGRDRARRPATGRARTPRHAAAGDGPDRGRGRGLRHARRLRARAGRAEHEARALFYLASAVFAVDGDRCLAAAQRAVELSRDIGDELFRARTRGSSGYWHSILRGWRPDDASRVRGGDRGRAAEPGPRAAEPAPGSLLLFPAPRGGLPWRARAAEEGSTLALEVGDAYEYLFCQYAAHRRCSCSGNGARCCGWPPRAARWRSATARASGSCSSGSPQRSLRLHAFDFKGARDLAQYAVGRGARDPPSRTASSSGSSCSPSAELGLGDGARRPSRGLDLVAGADGLRRAAGPLS